MVPPGRFWQGYTKTGRGHRSIWMRATVWGDDWYLIDDKGLEWKEPTEAGS
jgi:hypothetical protein